MWFAFFPYYVACVLTFITVLFVNKIIRFCYRLFYLFYLFHLCIFLVIFKKSLPNPRSQRFIPMFLSKCFLLLAIAFRSMIPCFLRVWCEVCVQLHFFVYRYVDVQHHLLEWMGYKGHLKQLIIWGGSVDSN